MRRFLILVALSLAGWASGGAIVAGGEEIKLGAIVPLSGSLAPYGKGCLDGFQIRIEEQNQAGGVNGAKLRLIIVDNKSDKSDSVAAYRKLVGTDRVTAVFGPVTSTNALELRRDAEQAKVPVITPTATNDKVTRKNAYMFRSCFKDSFQGQVVAQYVARRGLKKAAILTDTNSDYSKGLSASFKAAFEAAGGAVVAQEGYRQGDKVFGPQLKTAIEGGAEVIFVPGYPPEVPLIIKDAKAAGFAGRLCGADGWDQPSVLQESGDNIIDCFITGMFSAEDQRPLVQAFVKTVSAKLGKAPGTFEAQGYDTASLLIEALKRGTTPEAVKDGLLAIKDFEAVTGSITITPDGDAVKNAPILGIVKQPGGSYATKYLETVSP